MQIVDSDDDKQVENRILLLFQHLNNAVIQEDLRSHKWKQAWDILTLSPDSFSVHMDTKASSQAAADPTWLTNGHHSYDVTAALSPGVKSCQKCIFLLDLFDFLMPSFGQKVSKSLLGEAKEAHLWLKKRWRPAWFICEEEMWNDLPVAAAMMTKLQVRPCVSDVPVLKSNMCVTCVLSAPSISFRSTHLRVTW